jgi:hypothetical protein
VLSVKTSFVRTLSVALLSAFAVSQGVAQDDADARRIRYTTFPVPGAVALGVQSINNSDTIAGYYLDTAGNYKGFLRSSGGTLSTLIDPLDTATPGYTQAFGINNAGTVGGRFYDAAASTYSGFFYTNGIYTTYDVPNQPQFTVTAVYGVNNVNGFCGFIWPPPYTLISAFIGSGATASVFQVNGSTYNYCTGINDSGSTVGVYKDGAGVYHGWLRNSNGAITVIDVPGASTVPATVPCISTMVAGTQVAGINRRGEITGHFWDSSNNEHGFIRSSSGTFTQVDVPGAYQTAGGGVNDKKTMVGHWADSSCAVGGYMAKF